MVCNFLDSIETSQLKKVCKEFDVLIIYYLAADSVENLTVDSDYLLGIVFSDLAKVKIKDQQFFYQFKNKLKSAFTDTEISVVFLQAEEITVSFEIITTGEIIYTGEEEQVIKYEDRIISQGLRLQEDLDLYDDLNFHFE